MAKVFMVKDYMLTLTDRLHHVHSAIGVVYKCFDQYKRSLLMHASKIPLSNVILKNFLLTEVSLYVYCLLIIVDYSKEDSLYIESNRSGD